MRTQLGFKKETYFEHAAPSRFKWKCLLGNSLRGIGRPRPFRFIYSVDRRPFEEVINRQWQPHGSRSKNALLVLERLSGQSSSTVQ